MSLSQFIIDVTDHWFGHKKLLKSRTEVIISKMFISVHVTMKGSMPWVMVIFFNNHSHHLVSKEGEKLGSSAKVCYQGLNKAQLLRFRRGSFGRAKQGQEATDG